ncbi:MAG TPA: DUF4491 family protein [Anaerolineales bacterium]|nr:DUF4491 family protein [Anaerolineales bacterium]
MHVYGILLGLLTLLIIGLGFPLVIRGERHLGYLWWPYMMSAGVFISIASLFIALNWLSVSAGVLGAVFVWGSTELKEQAVRAEIGWYPFNSHKIPPPFAKTIEKWKAPHL